MKTAVLQLELLSGALPEGMTANRQHLAAACQQGRLRETGLCITPHLALMGYPPPEILFSHTTFSNAQKALQHLASDLTDGPALLTSLLCRQGEQQSGEKICHCLVLLQQGRVETVLCSPVSVQCSALSGEHFLLTEQKSSSFSLCLPAGKKQTIAVFLCSPDDLYMQETVNAVRELCEGRQADMLVLFSASPCYPGIWSQREDILRASARACGVPVVCAEQIGGREGVVFAGGSTAFDREGNLLARGRAFAEDIVLFDTDRKGPDSADATDSTDATNATNATNAIDTTHTGDGECTGDAGSVAVCADWPHPIDRPDRPGRPGQELLWQALVLGTRDYVQGCGFSSVLLGLSGGIDSALTAAVAYRALGADKVLGVLLPSPYSSQGSLDDSLALAAALGIQTQTIPLEPAMHTMESMLRTSFAGYSPDVTEENIQARIRGVLLMALSNKYGSLLLTTGNKSEVATGYCTLYGDTCGAFAPLCDIYKQQVYALSRWLNTTQGKEIIPQAIIDKPPSAELRPDQKDEDSLPPYDVLDAVLEQLLEGQCSPETIIARGFDAQTVHHITSLLYKAEYKRRQLPPGLSLTTCSLSNWHVPLATGKNGMPVDCCAACQSV